MSDTGPDDGWQRWGRTWQRADLDPSVLSAPMAQQTAMLITAATNDAKREGYEVRGGGTVHMRDEDVLVKLTVRPRNRSEAASIRE